MHLHINSFTIYHKFELIRRKETDLKKKDRRFYFPRSVFSLYSYYTRVFRNVNFFHPNVLVYIRDIDRLKKNNN